MAPGNARAVLWFCLFALLNFGAGILGTPTCQYVHGVPVKIKLPSGSLIESSPGLKLWDIIACERVCIPGLQRLENLKKYAHARRIKVLYSEGNSNTYSQKIELCIHRNASLGLGQCAHNQWKALEKGLWSGIVSPYETRFVDIRMPNGIFCSLTISVEEEFQPYRLILLGLALIILVLAPIVSKWVPFYYSSAMAFGIIVVILIILFQVMKLLPTGRKSTLYIVLYGSVVGLGSIILRYLSGLVHSILEELGFGEEMFNLVAVFLLLGIVITGAWFGFWGVRKLVLSEDGTVDRGIAQFVAWSIRIVASVMILQSSCDSLLALLMLAVGVIFTSAMTRVGTTFWHSRQRGRSLKNKRHGAKWAERLSRNSSHAEFLSRAPPKDVDLPRSKETALKWTPYSPHLASSSLATPKSTSPVSCILGSPLVASKKTPYSSLYQPRPSPSLFAPTNASSPNSQIDEQDYYSIFHKTPERKHFSKEEWEAFTKDSTKKALRELMSTPEFREWALENADSIMKSPIQNRQDTFHSENDSKVGVKQEHSSGSGDWFGW